MRAAYLAIAGTILLAGSAVADEVRYFEKDGITYMETRRVVQRPVVETRYEQREQVVYREQYQLDYQQTYRNVQVPVTEYRTMACLQNRWNPFAQPYFTYRTVPVQRYELRQQVVQTPVQRRELVPEKRIVQVPVTSQRIAEEEVITRVAVSAAPGVSLQSYGSATSGPIGGVARLDAPAGTATSLGGPRVSTFTPESSLPAQPATVAGSQPALLGNRSLSSTPSASLAPATTAARPSTTVSAPATSRAGTAPTLAPAPATGTAPTTTPGGRY